MCMKRELIYMSTITVVHHFSQIRIHHRHHYKEHLGLDTSMGRAHPHHSLKSRGP